MRNRLVGAIIILAAAIALAVTLLTSYDQRKSAECQTQVNESFLAVIRQRAEIGDEDRDSVRDLFQNLVTAQKKVEKGQLTSAQYQVLSEQEVATYFARQKILDEQRSNNPLPDELRCNDNNSIPGDFK